MRLLPRSLTSRLLVTAGCALLVGIVVSAVAIAGVLKRFVMRSLDARLDTEIVLLARALDRNPSDVAAALHGVDLPPFTSARSGWGWQVTGPFGVILSASSNAGHYAAMSSSPRAPDQPPHLPPDPPPEALQYPAERVDLHGMTTLIEPRDGKDSAGRPLHYRIVTFGDGPDTITIIAAAPSTLVEQPLRAAAIPLAESVLVMIVVMMVALAIQIRIGLGPVTRLRAMVAEIRSGRSRRIAIAEPTELLPLIDELNALIVANEHAVAQARTHVSNLAHGLKTPLAALKLDLANEHGAGATRVLVLIERMERQIRHHLGRARAAAAGSVASPSILLAPHIEDLAAALLRLYYETPRNLHLEAPDNISVRCDPQDLDELLGNVLDNAWRHAATQIHVSAVPTNAKVVIAIEDDGAGLSDVEIALVIQEGRRLDERVDGWGFGLAISRELCELHGGSLTLEHSALGGLSVRITLNGV